MTIHISRFGGIIPKLDPTELPGNAAQIAKNCDLVSNTLRPINVKVPFLDLKENDLLKSDLDPNDVFTIPTPLPPSLIERVRYIKDPTSWMKCRRSLFVTHVYDNGGSKNQFHYYNPVEPQAGNGYHWQRPKIVKFTETGLRLTYTFPEIAINLNGGDTYKIKQPIFEFELDGSIENGGPDETISLPANMATNYNSHIPSGVIPLTIKSNPGEIYGYFQVVDTDANIQTEELLPPKTNTEDHVIYYDSWRWKQQDISFDIDLNYANTRRRIYYYVQSMVKERGEITIEGPPSDVSEKLVLLPGEYAKLNLPFVEGYKMNNLYRSASNSDSFRLVKEVDDEEYEDLEDLPLGQLLPPFGDKPNAPVGDFLEGSILHPAQFGVAFKGKILYFSDYKKFHTWPFQVLFNDDIKAIILSGNTIIVFAGDNVYGSSGSNPETMSKYLITSTAPLLSKLSLARINGSVFYASLDGLFALSAGSGARNLTSEFYTRNEWDALKPITFKAKTADNSLFLEGDISNLRFDLDESINAITTFTATTNAGNLIWKSRKYKFNQETLFDFVRIDADADVTLKIFIDGIQQDKEYMVKNYDPVLLEKADHGFMWEFQLESSDEIRSFDAYERRIIDMRESISLSPQNNLAWRMAWLKFPDGGAFSGGILTTEDDKQIQIEFYHDGLNLTHIETVTSGRVFKLPSCMPTGTLWRISIPNKSHTIKSLILFSRIKSIIKRGRIHEFRQDPTVAPWMLKTYESQKPISFSAAQIKATAYPVKVKFFANESTTELYEVTFSNDRPRRLPFSRTERYHSFEIDECESFVQEFAVATSMAGLKG